MNSTTNSGGLLFISEKKTKKNFSSTKGKCKGMNGMMDSRRGVDNERRRMSERKAEVQIRWIARRVKYDPTSRAIIEDETLFRQTFHLHTSRKLTCISSTGGEFTQVNLKVAWHFLIEIPDFLKRWNDRLISFFLLSYSLDCILE